VHAKTLRQIAGVQLLAVADAIPAAAQALAAEVGTQVMSTEHMLDTTAIDAVIVASSTDTHAQFTTAAVQAGKAVFCEKPLDLDLQRACSVAQVAQHTGSPLFVGFNRRFDPQFSAIKQRIKTGDIGPLEQLTITSRDPEPPPLDYVSVSGGLFRDMMIHDFDMARYLLDLEPCSVFAQGASLVDPAIGQAGDIDTATVVMTTASGQQVQIINSRRAAYGYDQRVEAFGAQGMLQAKNILQSEVKYMSAQGEVGSLPEAFFMERYAQAYAIELTQFVKAVESGKAMPVSGYDGVAALYLAERAVESFASGQCVHFDLASSLQSLLVYSD
jgi:myo-inositol 2-dehydrogenase/D-chiro-inositol 1-dehydrogenase